MTARRACSTRAHLAFVTAINTVGNGLIIDVESETPVLAPGSYGGLGGPAVQAIALGNVRKLRQKLRPDIAVIGCGGVDSGEAAFKHLLCGASAVMVASALLTEGEGVFARIQGELLAIMKAKGYATIADFQGKLRDAPVDVTPSANGKPSRAHVPPSHIEAANKAASVKYASFAEVPVIDFSPFYGGDATARAELGAKMLAAFKDIGFVTLVNHDLPTELNSRTFAESAKFFTSLTPEQKAKYAWETPSRTAATSRWVRSGSTAVCPTLKETFEIGNEAETTYLNRWPKEELPGFRETMLEYFNAADKLHLDVLRCLAIAMGLGEEFFTPLCDGNHQNLRLLHYPECPKKKISAGGQKRGGVHSDYGSITLLTQWQDRGGLEACRKDGEWVFVPPTAGGVIVNVADCMMRWSNDVLRSTPHRVLSDPRIPEDAETEPERYSIAFFCRPSSNRAKELQADHRLRRLPSPGCSSEDNPYRYKPITAFDYITMRLSGTIDQ